MGSSVVRFHLMLVLILWVGDRGARSLPQSSSAAFGFRGNIFMTRQRSHHVPGDAQLLRMRVGGGGVGILGDGGKWVAADAAFALFSKALLIAVVFHTGAPSIPLSPAIKQLHNKQGE